MHSLASKGKTIKYGLGWQIRENIRGETRHYHHGGSIYGYYGYVTVRQDDSAEISFSNIDSYDDINKQIAVHMIDALLFFKTYLT